MFDPTVFDNLKVAIENQVYDLDNIAGQVLITHRIDRMELAVMARIFALQFKLVNGAGITAEIRLEASLKDIAAELLEQSGENSGCTLRLRFYMPVQDANETCKAIEEKLETIWQPEMPPTQTLSFGYGEQQPITYHNEIELHFNRKINEDQMEDLPELIDHMLQTLEELDKLA
ncbi:hypothetical protein A8990_1663 [Paenibacillus taihuensis]|uniref:Uncharacterized protein n=1 Tax=Paenibacillus taihuensis TaxID=1156355 RepID=A0A3D9Q3B5_9BACL|nr:hypothetical protein [Paenibacillus taihuensis]REE56266.1 hypothetical protein A8990_1663 [Paenibacillus taihuensis]